jgi:hypothetical protein
MNQTKKFSRGPTGPSPLISGSGVMNSDLFIEWLKHFTHDINLLKLTVNCWFFGPQPTAYAIAAVKRVFDKASKALTHIYATYFGQLPLEWPHLRKLSTLSAISEFTHWTQLFLYWTRHNYGNLETSRIWKLDTAGRGRWPVPVRVHLSAPLQLVVVTTMCHRPNDKQEQFEHGNGKTNTSTLNRSFDEECKKLHRPN